jgi:hypothetical protein
MRFLGTLMLLACVAMLLFPVYWEGRHHAGQAAGEDHPAGAAVTSRSTLTSDDLLPRWRGPVRRGDQDG